MTAGLCTLGTQATTKVVQPYINIRPTITMEAGDLCTVLLTKPLHLPAMWQGSSDCGDTEATMTRAEQLALKIQRDKEALEKRARCWPERSGPAGRDPEGDEQAALPGRRAGG